MTRLASDGRRLKYFLFSHQIVHSLLLGGPLCYLLDLLELTILMASENFVRILFDGNDFPE